MRVLNLTILLMSFIIFKANAQDLNKLWEQYTKKEYSAVLEEALPLLTRNPDNMGLNLLIGRAYTENGRYSEAIPYLKKVQGNDINKPNKAWSLNYLARCYYFTDNPG